MDSTNLYYHNPADTNTNPTNSMLAARNLLSSITSQPMYSYDNYNNGYNNYMMPNQYGTLLSNPNIYNSGNHYSKTDHSNDYSKDDRYNDYNKDDRYNNYRKEDHYNDYRKEDRYSDYRKEDRYSDYRKEDRYSDYRKEDRYNDYCKEDRYNDYCKEDRYNDYCKEDRYNDYCKEDRYNDYRKDDRYNDYRNDYHKEDRYKESRRDRSRSRSRSRDTHSNRRIIKVSLRPVEKDTNQNLKKYTLDDLQQFFDKGYVIFLPDTRNSHDLFRINNGLLDKNTNTIKYINFVGTLKEVIAKHKECGHNYDFIIGPYTINSGRLAIVAITRVSLNGYLHIMNNDDKKKLLGDNNNGIMFNELESKLIPYNAKTK
jgi:hypothetical protein